MTRIFPLLLAGGAGQRFWPASRELRPKQLLQLTPGRTLLRGAYDRACMLGEAGDVLTVLTDKLVEPTLADLKGYPEENLVIEPARRNTAAAIGFGALVARQRGGEEAIIAALPADHHIASDQLFAATCMRACELAAGGAIVTVGITPTRVETGYGYLEVGAPLVEGGRVADGAHLRRFVEKPNRPRAEVFFDAGPDIYLWNSGMFFFTAGRLLAEIERHMPALAEGLRAIDSEPERTAEIYQSLPADLPSIDFGVMERAEGLVCVAAPRELGWNDVGSWAALRDLLTNDDNGNVQRGDALLVGSRGCVVDARGGRLVGIVGATDLCVIDTGDAVLVCPVDEAQRVRELVQALRDNDRTELL